MKTQVGKWGNSLAVRIPRAVARAAKLEDGALVELSVDEGRLVVTPVGLSYSLSELVGGIRPENRHDETDWGKPLGNELW
jgi:antitoxin MazE